jgi:hypothetical protein
MRVNGGGCRIFLVFVLLFGATGCGQGTEPGSLSFSFEWEEEPESDVYIWIRVEERLDIQIPGPILGSDGPALMQPGKPVRLSVSGIENGADRVVVVEVRTGKSPALPITYYGISEPFEIRPGRNTVVKVPLSLVQPGTEIHQPKVELLFNGSTMTTVGPGVITSATIRTTTAGVSAMWFSVDPSFGPGTIELLVNGSPDLSCQQVDLDGLIWDVCDYENWDLTANTSLSGDTTYSVFVKFADLFGYESAVYKASVNLDATPPLVLASSLAPAYAHVDETVLLAVTFHETIVPDGTFLSIQPNHDEAPVFSGPERVADSSTYVWTTTIPAGQSDDASYSFSLESLDDTGNQSEPQELMTDTGQLLKLRVDAVAPVVSQSGLETVPAILSPTGDPVLMVGSGGEIRAAFEVEEANALADGYPQVVLASPTPIEFALLGETERVGGHTEYNFSLGIDPVEFVAIEGNWPVRIDVADEAGNHTTIQSLTDKLVRIDFTEPTAQCSISPEVAKKGDTVRLMATFSESVQPATVTIQTDLDFVLNESLSTSDSPFPTYVFEAIIGPESSDSAWGYSIFAQDLVGNPDTEVAVCSGGGDVDTTFIAVTDFTVLAAYEDPDEPGEWIETGLFATAASVIKIVFTLDDSPADGSLSVMVGVAAVTDCLADGDTWSCTYVVPGVDIDNPLQIAPVTVSARDEAGNQTIQTIASVTLDFQPPELAGTPYFERCDSYAPAREGPNDIWVRAIGQCSYSVDPTDCSAPADPFSGTVRASFAINESIDLDYSSISVAGHDFLVDPCSTSSNYIVALYTPTLDEPEGECISVVASVRDQAGTKSDLNLGCLRFDYTVPESADVQTTGRIVYTRIPTGNQTTGGLSHFSVAGQVGSVESMAEVTILDKADLLTASILGSAMAQEDGSFGGAPGTAENLSLQSIDRPEVFIAVTDQAGNVSDAIPESETIEATLVRHIHWYATLAGKVANSKLPNPHSLLSVPIFQTTAIQNGSTELSDGGKLGSKDGLVHTTSTAPSWSSWLPSKTAPSRRDWAHLSYDSARGRLVLFGGNKHEEEGFGVELNDTWEWDGYQWYLIAPDDPEGDGNPDNNFFADNQLVYDQRTGGFVLITFNDQKLITWRWNGASWKQLFHSTKPGEDAPYPRSYYSAIYDSIRGKTVLFGGYYNQDCFEGNGKYCAHTWEWDGVRWKKHLVASPGMNDYPQGSSLAGAYNEARQRIVVFGGHMDNTESGETWEYDSFQWLKRTPEDPELDGNPSPRAGASMAYHRGTGTVFMTGGSNVPSCSEGNSVLCEYVWEWNGVSWRKIIPADPEKDGHPKQSKNTRNLKLIYADNLDSLLLYTHDGHLWRWTGLSWEKNAAQSSGEADLPSARGSLGMAYDESTHTLVVTGGKAPGGCNESAQELCGATWRWNGRKWQMTTATDPNGELAPEPRRGHTVAYLQSTNQVVLFGGADKNSTPLQDLWSLTGEQWQFHETPAQQSPSARCGHSFTPLPLQGSIMLAGGTDECSETDLAWNFFSDIWFWNGTVWTQNLAQHPDELPFPRYEHKLVKDYSRQMLVLFGGWMEGYSQPGQITNIGQLSEWYLAHWIPEFEASAEWLGPGSRNKFALTYDAAWEKTILFGGESSTINNELWGWDGVDWELIPTSDPEGDGNPEARSGHEAIYHEGLQKVVVFGGLNTSDNALWFLDRQQEARPAQVFTVKFEETGHVNSSYLRAAALSWQAGGSGNNSAVGTVQGTELYLWDMGKWNQVDSNPASPENPEELTWYTTNPATLSRQPAGLSHDFTFAVSTTGKAGLEGASIATDTVEFQLEYSLASPAELDCQDLHDNDLNGLFNCADPACAASNYCTPGVESNCTDGADNDGDELTDCLDQDCWCEPACNQATTGCCSYDVLHSCAADEPLSINCEAEDNPSTCGWNGQTGQYECGFAAADPSGNSPLVCPGLCEPDCTGKECGSDGCSGSCGMCPGGEACSYFKCFCQLDCTMKNCGPDGCGDICGECKVGENCDNGICQFCQPDCSGQECGDDGCGGSCGTCPWPWTCTNQHCVSCNPQCNGKSCGDDGCGGSCGSCSGNKFCQDGQCHYMYVVDCTPGLDPTFCDEHKRVYCDDDTNSYLFANCIGMGGTECTYVEQFQDFGCIGESEVGDPCPAGYECDWTQTDICIKSVSGDKFCTSLCEGFADCPFPSNCCAPLKNGDSACASKEWIPSYMWPQYCP